MKEDGALFDSGFDDTGPFRVSPESGGVSLETALRDFGPAAIDDLIPRLRALASTLDAAHRAGIVHGALHPSRIFVTDEATELVAGKGAARPYAAPEVIEGHGATPLSDQYALAAIAYEWLFGRAISHHGERPIEVQTMPGVDRSALSKAFTRALAPDAADRFASCGAFVDAMHGAIVPELPLLADVEDFEAEDAQPAAAAAAPAVAAIDVDDVKIAAEESIITAGQPDLDAIDPVIAATPAAEIDEPRFAAAPPPARQLDVPRFGPLALFVAVIVGAIFGFAAGYMARPRALQSAPPQTFAEAPGTADDVAKTQAPKVVDAPKAPAPKAAQAPPVVPAPAPKAAENIGRLLVRSTPSGASVTVDGVPRGETPVALRDLGAGTRTVVVSRNGYVTETRRVSISKGRPSRTLDVRLAAVKPRDTTPRPSTPATLGRPAADARPGATTGTLAVDSRPPGAAVTINGKPAGTTPLTVDDLAPGEYRIGMSMRGFQNFSTTVRVVAGERVRAAYSLTALEQQ